MTVLADLTTAGWTRTAQQICTDALEHLNVLGEGETAKPSDMQRALGALDAILKELPLSGYTWPQLSGEVELPWGSVQTFILPLDYFGFPVVWKAVNGQKVQLTPISHAAWVAMPDRASASGEPTHFYISAENVLSVYPTPSADPALTLQYQKIVPDASATTATALPQYWIGALGYGVANELALKYGIPQATRVEIAQRWSAKRDRALEYSIGSEPISIEVQE